jgi:hypothetical protein
VTYVAPYNSIAGRSLEKKTCKIGDRSETITTVRSKRVSLDVNCAQIARQSYDVRSKHFYAATTTAVETSNAESHSSCLSDDATTIVGKNKIVFHTTCVRGPNVHGTITIQRYVFRCKTETRSVKKFDPRTINIIIIIIISIIVLIVRLPNRAYICSQITTGRYIITNFKPSLTRAFFRILLRLPVESVCTCWVRERCYHCTELLAPPVEYNVVQVQYTTVLSTILEPVHSYNRFICPFPLFVLIGLFVPTRTMSVQKIEIFFFNDQHKKKKSTFSHQRRDCVLGVRE